MNDGVLTVDMKGIITSVNPAALKMLEIEEKDILGSKYMEIFFEYEENDAFNQIILDSVYESSVSHNRIVNYFTGEKSKALFMTTSFLQIEQSSSKKKLGVIAVFSDVTELEGLRDAVKAMEKIKELNNQLEIRNQFISETFGRYLSDDIVASFLEKPETLELGGKKKPTTIVMTDLRGFTTMSEQLPPETVVNMLNNYLAKMIDIIYEYNGTILEFIGDAIMVIFGAPIWCEDHAAKAVACAISMQSAMDEVNRWNQENGFPEIEMGIGINTGDVIIGNIGSEKRTKYGAIGRHVNLTARVESYTVGGQILISPGTKESIKTELKIQGEMLVTPKGIKKPIIIYDIIGIGEPFNLLLENLYINLVDLSQDIHVRISLLEDKHCVGNYFDGIIKKISMREAQIQVIGDIPKTSDIKIQILDKGILGNDKYDKIIADDIYAKVSEIKEDMSAIFIKFTWISQAGKEIIKSHQEA